MSPDLLRKIPSVDSLISEAAGEKLIERYGREEVINAARVLLEEIRSSFQEGKKEFGEEDLAPGKILESIRSRLEHKYAPSLKYGINATGVILHTGLGRAVLSESARAAVNDVMISYCSLAVDQETGRRGHRDVHLDALLCELTGAEAATVVNNNAAATVLILNTLAKGREVIISRGQLVEIGGSFRMPEVMEASGAVMREVGTTNKTHLRDYADAINENTGALMRVHHSNYRIMGFSEEPGIEDLVELAGKCDIPVIDDLGSGSLIDLEKYGLETEPLVQKSIQAGVDTACFSGDKLIGGPQSGVIIGKKAIVGKIRKNPLARAFRIGKLTIAAMESTLKLFFDPEKLGAVHPVYRMFAYDLDELEKRAQRIVDMLKKPLSGKASVSVQDEESRVGSGSVPIQAVASKALIVEPGKISAEQLAKKLRLHLPPIFTRVQRDKILFDLRTIQPDEDLIVTQALLEILECGE